MKELTIEQKAKAYDEALKVLHKYDGENIMFSQSLKEEMFPDLKEDEDERTRKEIILFIQMEVEDEIVGNKWLAWLEKQGEQKPYERKDFTSIPFGAFDSELVNETITIPEGCVATIEGNKIHIKKK